VRERLAHARRTTPLFDTPAYARALERVYEDLLRF
jgi:predicted O-linked N-acetylglucosamine transferase (SPINDLY family)